ncbi:MAG: thioredoxin domain-containing protein, partial [Limisphaerales bacterium]
MDWYAWSPEAFEKATRENKPIFVSIGYSTCHWCHVMERESFESETIAKFLNEHFVSIKVDREERPDVDKIYMTFVQATTGQGGWPLNVFLTPDLKPFFGGTYFPPAGMQGRPGFLQLLQHIDQLWQSRHGDVVESARDIYSRLEQMTETNTPPSEKALDKDFLRKAGAAFKETYDSRHGGFGGAP